MTGWDDIDRMLSTAGDYQADAERLEASLVSSAWGGYVLRLLQFEILLKALRKVHGLTLRKDHGYWAMFDGLPDHVQSEVHALARDRVRSSSMFDDLKGLLETYSGNFIRCRYAYEEYQGMTQASVEARADAWFASGARVEDADFRFYPSELFGMSWAIARVIEQARPSDRSSNEREGAT